MRGVTLILGAAAMLAVPQFLEAQTKPSFGGNWTIMPDSAASPPTGAAAAAAATGGAARGGGARGGRGGGFGRGGGMLAGLGDGATIVQDEKTLTITRTTQAGELKSVYNLDGSDSRNTLTLGGRMGGGGGGGGGAAGGGIETVSKARWDANKLVIATTLTFGQNSFETTMSLSLDDKGNLVIESTNPGRGGAVPTTTKTSYRKS